MKASGVLSRDPQLAAIAFEAEIEETSPPQAPRATTNSTMKTSGTAAPGRSMQPAASPASAQAPAPQRTAALPTAGMGAGAPGTGKSSLFGPPAPSAKPGLFDDNAAPTKTQPTKNPLG